jgi:hypothetical protein
MRMSYNVRPVQFRRHKGAERTIRLAACAAGFFNVNPEIADGAPDLSVAKPDLERF